MPLAAAASNSGALVASVPQVRIVLTPIFATSGRSLAASAGEGPQVSPLTWYGEPSTVSCQLPCEPVTLTTLPAACAAGAWTAASPATARAVAASGAAARRARPFLMGRCMSSSLMRWRPVTGS